MMFLSTEEINSCHIKEMDHSKSKHNLTSHNQYTAHEFLHVIHRLPGPDHQSSITQIEQVIPG